MVLMMKLAVALGHQKWQQYDCMVLMMTLAVASSKLEMA